MKQGRPLAGLEQLMFLPMVLVLTGAALRGVPLAPEGSLVGTGLAVGPKWLTDTATADKCFSGPPRLGSRTQKRRAQRKRMILNLKDEPLETLAREVRYVLAELADELRHVDPTGTRIRKHFSTITICTPVIRRRKLDVSQDV